ncbi:MAG: CPBP family intramembrane metalloprotease [Bacteroidales bacterium]|nr:CPBP family intramembrane metalloprotease [Bacteroidales bacterium]
MKLFRTDKTAYFELAAVSLTVILKFILMDWLSMRAFYIGGICLFWALYFYYRYSRNTAILKQWGFKRFNFRKSGLELLPFLLICICISVIYGVIRKVSVPLNHILPVLVLYPVWGIVQQFMLVNILAENLRNLRTSLSGKFTVILLTSVIFSLVHYPVYLLMVFTLVMEVLFLKVYFKWRNLWAIGIAHGWAATFIICYILERDLWVELFAWF